jgi:hypothetical protein
VESRRYLIELERPASGWVAVGDMAARARAAAAALRDEGVPVRFLRSVFVPEDDACFFLYEAPSREVVRVAVEHAAARVADVSERVPAGPGEPA